MSRRWRVFRLVHLRRGIQVLFLLAFFGLLVLARPVTGEAPSPLLKSFFLIDPLIALTTFLAAHALPLAALLSLVVVGLTLVFGRVFCGWACPLGTLNDLAGRFFDLWRRKGKPADHWSRWQLARYYLLAGFLVMAVVGGHWVTVFDPLVLLYRTTTTALMPGAQWAVEEGSTAVYQADPGWGKARLTVVTEPVYVFFRDHVFSVQKQVFLGAGLIFLLFAGILALNAWRRRFWCRYLCPLGALLGVFAWRPLVRWTVNKETCNGCDLCGLRCHGAAAEGPAEGWKSAECLGCLNCRESCPRGSVAFRLGWPWGRQPGRTKLGLSRRAALAAGVSGLVGLAGLRFNAWSRGRRFHAALIRPPGARPEPDFLARCTACGLCMKICQTGGLQPSLGEAGLEGLWTPRLVPEIGHCYYECNLCGQVCPTGAIEPLTPEAKQEVHIGLAAFDTTRCIPYAYGRDCMVCEEHCPIPDKAIYFLEVEIRDRDGGTKTIKQPHVDPDLCIGCGYCENVCVFLDRPGIRVTSANETRNPHNQPILPGDDLYY